MSKQTKQFQVMAGLLLVVSALWIFWTSDKYYTDSGEPLRLPKEGFFAPDFVLTDREGLEYQLEDFSGTTIVINFWASWCPPCKAEMPAMQEVYNHYSDGSVEFIAVNVTNQDKVDAAVQLADQVGITFPVLFDYEGSVASLYRVRGLPSTYFIDSKGKIRKIIIGGPMSEALIKSQLSEIMGGAE